jgi:tetratricopeptide (TPR) repeat protein
MTELIASTPCPNCERPIGGDGHCAECGLDATLLFAIRRSAETLARQSARRAGDGQWQKAYDAAAESLRLVANENDLAAFVLLVSSLAGARGSVRQVAKPDPQRLPTELRGPLEELLATLKELRSILQVEDEEEAARRVRELQARHPGLRLFGEIEAPVAVTSLVLRETQPSRRFLAMVAAAMLLVALLGGWAAAGWAGRQGERERLALAQRLHETEERLRQQQETRPSPPVTPPQDPWLTALAALDQPETAPAAREAGVRDLTSRAAWKQGRAASRAGRYKEAKRWLELAVQGPRESDYRDDALYYLAKTCHRLGERERAEELYQRVMREAAPGSNFAFEAQRLLGLLRDGKGVDR